jgi:SHS2 domain-containing protein
MTETSLRFIEHTADVGIEVDAGTLAELFLTAASGMFTLLGESGEDMTAASTPVENRRISLDADDIASLMVAWLRELLFIHESTGLALHDAEFGKLDETRLDALISLAPAPPPAREIKGVTWHQLTVRRQNGAWHARVIFDV